MPTNPPTRLLDRDLSKALIREWINLANPLLREVVNYGVAAFARCLQTGKGGSENLAILMPYLHLLEMVDGIQILLAEAAPSPAQLQLRSAFEALLTIEYITEADTMRRAHAYLVTDIYRRLATIRAMDPNTAEGKRARERMAADAYTGSTQLVSIEDSEAAIKIIETTLQKPHWKEASVEYQMLKRSLKRRPVWHQLYGGPKSVEKLATYLNRPAHYDILYRPWSETAHASDTIYRKLTAERAGEAAVRRLRDTAEFHNTVGLAVTFALRATRRILSHYRPQEIPAFTQWYVREVREAFARFVGPTLPEEVG